MERGLEDWAWSWQVVGLTLLPDAMAGSSQLVGLA